MSRLETWLIPAAGLLALGVTPSTEGAREIGPEANLCAEINTLSPGEELVLALGDYQGPCAIRRGGVPKAPKVIRGADSAHRPRNVHGGRDANVIEVRASHVIIRGLDFGPTQSEVDAVRVFGTDDVTIENCHFTDIGAIAVVANHSNVHGLVVRNDVIRDSLVAATYFGCHDGITCSITGLRRGTPPTGGATEPPSGPMPLNLQP